MSQLSHRMLDAELLAQAEREQATRDENIAWARKIAAAAEFPGLAGNLRRAVRAAKRLPSQLAEAIGIEPRRLDKFLVAEGTLTSDELDRLADAMNFRLTPISTNAPKPRQRGSAKGMLVIHSEDDDHLADFKGAHAVRPLPAIG